MNTSPLAKESATIVNMSTWAHVQEMDSLQAVWSATRHSSVMHVTSATLFKPNGSQRMAPKQAQCATSQKNALTAM
jgi:hypothetical protein